VEHEHFSQLAKPHTPEPAMILPHQLYKHFVVFFKEKYVYFMTEIIY